jgi:hypothetical protein
MKTKNMSSRSLSHMENISSLIRTIRGQKVLLDSDLAKIYGTTTRILNRAMQRNRKRFPADFMFQLTQEEFENLKSQFGPSSSHGGRRKLPYAFTEKGAVMTANILNSAEAVRMSIFVVRAFIEMRELLGGTKELAKQLAALEKKLTERLDGHEVAIIEVLRRVMDILDPPPPPPDPPRRQIGFHVEPEAKPKTKRKKKA